MPQHIGANISIMNNSIYIESYRAIASQENRVFFNRLQIIFSLDRYFKVVNMFARAKENWGLTPKTSFW